jgi:hypothetical protein
MPEVGTTIVLQAPVGQAAGLTAAPGVVVLTGGRRGLPAVEAMADEVAASPTTAVVLARPPWADPVAAAVAGVAMLLDREVVWLPSDLSQAAWASSLIVQWAATTSPDDLLRRAQVAVGLASLPACRLPRRPWGCERAPMPALRPIALARWCDRLWSPCAHCTTGGGAPGGTCGRCGHGAVAA